VSGAESAGGRLARERLEAYQRYSDLVAEQEAALERGDLEAFAEASRAALEVQAGLGAAAAVRDLVADPEAASPDFVERTIAILRTTARRNERIQTRLQTLRSGDGRRAGAAGASRIQRYMEDGAETGPRFDLRF
jgi:hypothetical protein